MPIDHGSMLEFPSIAIRRFGALRGNGLRLDLRKWILPMSRATKTGFTLIELMVVVTILGLMMALLLPALQSAREAARRIQCTSNMKQLGLGLQQYETNYGVYPPSVVLSGNGNTTTWVGGWSVNGRILSFMEQNTLFNAVNFFTNQTSSINLTVTALSIGVFICPSEVNPQSYDATYGSSAVSTVGWCMGDWYVWGGFGALPNRTAFGPNLSRCAADFRDGLSSTLMASEVRSHQAEQTNCAVLASMNTPSQPLQPDVPPTQISPQVGGDGTCVPSSAGHVSWADGSVDQSGMTTAWPPDTKVVLSVSGGAGTILGSFSNEDVDLVGIPVSKGGPTYAAVTSRSYHPGGVNALFGDGSVHFIKQTIDGNVWRSLGSVNGGEIISADQY